MHDAGPGVTRTLVSVVVINHNYGRFLNQSIQSALRQSHGSIEVVVVDDGSVDESGTILDTLDAAVVQVRQRQGGHVQALNAGFAACSGDVVVFLDADDVLYPECVATVLESWRDGCAKLQYRLDTIDAQGRDLQLRFPNYPHDLGAGEIRRRALLDGYYPWPVSSGNAFARTYLDCVMPIDSTVIFKSPDGFLNKMAPLYGDVLTTERILGAYRVHGRNAWAHLATSAALPDYARTVRFDAVLHQAFVDQAASRGLKVGPYEAMSVPSWLEMRLLSLRFARARHPIADDSTRRALQQALSAAARAPDATRIGRMLWAAWFIALAVLPKRLLATCVRLGRSQSRRGALARLAVASSRRS